MVKVCVLKVLIMENVCYLLKMWREQFKLTPEWWSAQQYSCFNSLLTIKQQNKFCIITLNSIQYHFFEVWLLFDCTSA